MDLSPFAASLACDVAALQAVVDVESAGSGFDEHGRPTIRVEAHRLWHIVGERHGNTARVDAVFRVLGPQPWEGHRCLLDGQWIAYHGDQDREYQALLVARGVDVDAGLEATSWGLGQVMGANWQRLGYTSPTDFVTAQQTEAGQLDTMARFIAADQVLLAALRAHDWRTFAARYNGTGKVDDYAGRLAAAFARH